MAFREYLSSRCPNRVASEWDAWGPGGTAVERIHMALAIYAGTFDPITNGHLSVVRQAVTLFGHVVVLIADNPEKKTLFSIDERIELTKAALKDLPTASVATTRGMVVDHAKNA